MKTLDRSVNTLVVLFAGILCLGVATDAGSGSVSLENVYQSLYRSASEASPELDDDPCYPLDFSGRELARALDELKTRDARQLVWVMQNASPEALGESLTLHLAIAHAETRGHVLAISASGAAGLAQATPIAILSEGLDGPLFVNDEYVRGAEAYFLKKPLGDADKIASYLLKRGARRDRAIEMLASAWELRREGFDELDHLEAYGGDQFADRREILELENEEVLRRLGTLIESRSSSSRIRAFRDQTRRRYRALRNTQRHSWAKYRDVLELRRDAILIEAYGVDAEQVLEIAPYEAGEILASKLDVRFSPTSMALFLPAHLDTKRDQARTLGIEEEDVERVAIGLYNGGLPNMKRMMSGLIGRLPETDRYMRRVPYTRDQLDASLADVELAN